MTLQHPGKDSASSELRHDPKQTEISVTVGTSSNIIEERSQKLLLAIQTLSNDYVEFLKRVDPKHPLYADELPLASDFDILNMKPMKEATTRVRDLVGRVTVSLDVKVQSRRTKLGKFWTAFYPIARLSLSLYDSAVVVLLALKFLKLIVSSLLLAPKCVWLAMSWGQSYKY